MAVKPSEHRINITMDNKNDQKRKEWKAPKLYDLETGQTDGASMVYMIAVLTEGGHLTTTGNTVLGMTGGTAAGGS